VEVGSFSGFWIFSRRARTAIFRKAAEAPKLTEIPRSAPVVLEHLAYIIPAAAPVPLRQHFGKCEQTLLKFRLVATLAEATL
jgi:hypothetical protein